MFVRRSEPLLLTEDGLDGLCASLNRPVVDIEDLPVGPARALIALHRDDQGRPGLSVALRAEHSGAVTLFAFRGELSGSVGPAMDAGLAFAESMGFLFDDDMLQSGDPAARDRALTCWYELVGEEPPAAEPGLPVGEAPLLLDDLMDPLDELMEELDFAPLSSDPLLAVASEDMEPLADPPEATADEPATAGASVLTKFRRSPEPPEDTADDPEGMSARLGRIPIVRRRRSEEQDEAPALLTRLLARF
jgi:hypothetical protein